MAKRIIGYLNLFSDADLGPLTETRALGSTSFLGRYALMDFALSNFTNSKIDDINVLCKDNFRSISSHIGALKTWVNNTKIGHQHILINENGIKNPEENTDLNCIAANEWALDEVGADLVVVAPAHIISVIDLRKATKAHRASGADVTVAFSTISNGDKAFNKTNVLKLDNVGQVVEFKKNTGKVTEVNVSLETYIMTTEMLKKILKTQKLMKLGSLKKIVEFMVKDDEYIVKGYEYVGYVRCMDSFEHFVEYSMELLEKDTAFSLFHSKEWPIYTRSRNTPPTLYGENAKVKNSFIANGAHIDGTVINSVISRYVVIEKGAWVENSIILGNSVIKAGAVVSNAVIDRRGTADVVAEIKGTENKFKYLGQGKIAK